MILIDGIGIAPVGVSDPIRSSSPLLRELNPHESTPLPGGGWASPTRADLDVPGLPQSATGHTAILTGINAAQVLGRHFPGFPTVTLRSLIEAHNLLGRLRASGRAAEYVNAVRPLHPIVKKRNLRGAATVAAQSTGQRLREVEDIRQGRALHHDFTNRILVDHGEAVPLFTPGQAGRRLAAMARDLDLCFFEYFLTDLTGHAQDEENARDQVRRIDAFLQGVLEEANLDRTQVLVCSDHGNMEDLTVRTHTRNPVPTLVWGPGAEDMAGRVRSIQEIAPEILRILSSGDGSHSASELRTPKRGGSSP
jgi:2,3-bisphosphoglycerate-independent phosphoglycerate mutase